MTNVKELILGTGTIGSEEQVDTARWQVNHIREDIDDIRKTFIRLGFHLYEAQKCRYHIALGYDDFYEFCEANFHLSRSSVQRYIDVWSRFCEQDSVGDKKKMWLGKRWKDYNFSQLVEMLPLKDAELKEISPEMSVKDIREKKKVLRASDSCATSHIRIKYCMYDSSYECPIQEIQRKYFLKNGEVRGCAGCCHFCLERNQCKYRCAYAKKDAIVECSESPELMHPDVVEHGKLLSINPRISNAFITLGVSFEEQEIIQRDVLKFDAISEIHEKILENILDEYYDAAYINALYMLVYLSFVRKVGDSNGPDLC